MSTVLQDHALKNVWCNPSRDKQYIISGKRITNVSGAINFFSFYERMINLPVTGKRFHVYHVGALPASWLGMIIPNDKRHLDQWLNIKDIMNNNKMFVDIYLTNGLQFPRFLSYVLISKERGMFFATEVTNKSPTEFYNEPLYLKFYSNDYFSTLLNNPENEFIVTNGRKIGLSSDITALMSEEAIYKNEDGHIFIYKNGLKIDQIDFLNVEIGDVIEYVYDSSVKFIGEITASELTSFISERDTVAKFLIHPGNFSGQGIDFYDDVDLYILVMNGNKYKGTYFHRNSKNAIRMVTHRDYSIPVDYYWYTFNELFEILGSEPIDQNNVKIQVIIRENGYDRQTVYDNNRLFELYKLNSEQIIDALTGLNSTVTEWKAETLENSDFIKLMEIPYRDITENLVKSAYGYNAVTKILADTPQITSNNGSNKFVNLPDGLVNSCTVYEYGPDGTLNGHYYHNTGYPLYICHNNNTRLVEAILGEGTHFPNVKFGITNIDLTPNTNYRVYFALASEGIPTGDWEDITGSQYYTVVNNKVVWFDDDTNHMLMVRFDDTFLIWAGYYIPDHGFIKVRLTENEIRNESGQLNYNLPVMLGELDVWLNDHPIIKDLDWFLVSQNGFIDIYIVNKKWLIQPAHITEQKISYRFTGFSDSNGNPEAVEDFGFVQHGLLSNNNKFDIRDDKVLRIIYDGQLKHRGDILFSEENSGISIINSMNGKPYQIKDLLIPVRGLNENMYLYREASKIIDDRVSNYMTVHHPQPERNGLSAIDGRYQLVSPFLAHLTFNVLAEVILPETINKLLTDKEVIDICKDYEYMLLGDPLNKDYLNNGYVEILPHPLDNVIDLTYFQYQFINSVSRLYANGRFNMNAFYTFSL